MKRTFWDDVQQVAEEWKRLGWLLESFDSAGRKMWELTPLGCRMLRTRTCPTLH